MDCWRLMVMNNFPRTIAAGFAGGLAGSLLAATAFLAVDVLMPVHAQIYKDSTPTNSINGRPSYGGGAYVETWNNGTSSTIMDNTIGEEFKCHNNGNCYPL